MSAPNLGAVVPGELVPGDELEPGPKLPHESVYDRLRGRSAAAPAATAEVVSAQERIELPIPPKRGDAFMAGARLVRTGNENGWTHLATYTRIRHVSAKGAVRHVGTVAIRWQRPGQRVVGYWRTASSGSYVFAWAQTWHRRGPFGLTAPVALSAKGVAAVLALPAMPCVGCPRVLAAHRPTPAAPEDGPDATEAA